MTVVAPADSIETRKAVFALASYDKPIYMRLGRSNWPVLFTEEAPFEIGQATKMRDGDNLTLVAYGQMVAHALQAAERLSRDGVEARVLNMSTIEDLDHDKIDRAALETGAIIVTEEHQLDGGLGESIARYLAETNPVPMGFIAMPNKFGESGDPEELKVRYHLDTDSIVQKALQIHRRKVKG